MKDGNEKFDIVRYMTLEKDGIASYNENQCNIRLFTFKDMYVKQVEPEYPDMICSQVMYYGETLIMKKSGKYLKHGRVGIGIWEHYNEDGTLDHAEDMDEHFPVKWERMEQILKENDISLLTADSIFRYYDEKKDIATWTFVIKIALDKGCRYVFDARTGEMLAKEIVDMRKVK